MRILAIVAALLVTGGVVTVAGSAFADSDSGDSGILSALSSDESDSGSGDSEEGSGDESSGEGSETRDGQESDAQDDQNGDDNAGEDGQGDGGNERRAATRTTG